MERGKREEEYETHLELLESRKDRIEAGPDGSWVWLDSVFRDKLGYDGNKVLVPFLGLWASRDGLALQELERLVRVSIW
jgi:hypothetical protein